MPSYSWRRPRQVARHVHQRHDRDVEAIAEAHEPRRLAAGVDVQRPGEVHRLVRHETDAAAPHPPEPDHDVRREQLVDLHEVAVVDQAVDDVTDVVGPVRLGRDDASAAPRRPASGRRLVGTNGGSSALFEGRNESKRRTSASVASSPAMAKCATPEREACAIRAAELLVRDLLARHRADDVRPRDVHLARCLRS